MNVLVTNTAQQKLEDGHEKLRHSLGSAGENGTDRIKGIEK